MKTHPEHGWMGPASGLELRLNKRGNPRPGVLPLLLLSCFLHHSNATPLSGELSYFSVGCLATVMRRQIETSMVRKKLKTDIFSKVY